MKREIPPPVMAAVVVFLLGAVGFYFFYWSNRSNHGAGVTREEMRREFLQRAKNGQLPASPADLKKLQESAQ